MGDIIRMIFPVYDSDAIRFVIFYWASVVIETVLSGDLPEFVSINRMPCDVDFVIFSRIKGSKFFSFFSKYIA